MYVYRKILRSKFVAILDSVWLKSQSQMEAAHKIS